MFNIQFKNLSIRVEFYEECLNLYNKTHKIEISHLSN